MNVASAVNTQVRRASGGALALAFAWGLCEATFFFIVPDVLLSYVAMRRLREGMQAALAALVGALAGGALLFEIARRAPDDARSFLARVPGIDAELVAQVEQQVADEGLFALASGVVRGRPYKIYVVECAAAKISLAEFLLLSIPVRAARFFASAVLAKLGCAAISRLCGGRRFVEVASWAVFWIGFYALYFAKFGW